MYGVQTTETEGSDWVMFPTERRPSKRGKKIEKLIELGNNDADPVGSNAGSSKVVAAPAKTLPSRGSKSLKTNIPLPGIQESGVSSNLTRIPITAGRTVPNSSLTIAQADSAVKTEHGSFPEYDFAHSEISHLFHQDPRSPYYSPKFSGADFGNPNTQVGDNVVEPLHSLPIEPSRRNAELFHIFLERLSPYMSSLDGKDPSPVFNKHWVSFMIQSPLVIYIAILTSSYFRATCRNIDVERSVDAVAARVKLITLINEHISTHSKGVNDEAIAAVMSLAYNELVYADKTSVVAHLKGLREMLRTRGGIQNIHFKALRMMLMRTDFQVACTFECDPIVQGAQGIAALIENYPVEFESPLLLSNTRFVDSSTALEISVAAATILDDMRFVTTSLLSLGKNEDQQKARAKFLKTVQWIHDRLLASEGEAQNASDFIYQTCRATAIIYTSAILLRKPFSVACNIQLLGRVWMMMWRVPLLRWKLTPGIFFWVCLVVNPSTRARPEGRFVKAMVAAGTMAIGLVQWDVAVANLKNFTAVQRWLDGKDLEGSSPGIEGHDPLTQNPVEVHPSLLP
ncbi:hypothetical protein G7Y89_g845 [Cudoniella acicularis]|uniref:Uncharacterized protein n=1 Tax=Cudoniella acicularis TaxID=354080 RepID=A0A8H4RX79_9HELO|nr:hypothetical protein G7Y89_g845 [Cudoniella acicularis]